MNFLKKIIAQFLPSRYQSEIDKFLEKLAVEYSQPSESQQREIAKFKRICSLRDEAVAVKNNPKLWNKF